MVIAIIAILAALLLPALSKAKISSQRIQCMNNNKQLHLGFNMYTGDNADVLPDSRAWMISSVDDPSTPDFIDLNDTLKTEMLGPYIGKNSKIYKCPGDPRKSTMPGHKGTPCARSISMNSYIGVDGSGNSHWNTDFFGFRKTSDLRRPGPAGTFVFLDEGLSINDGFFATDMDTYDPNNMPGKHTTDVPATYHNLAGSFSFADGHAEIHKWKDGRTSLPLGYGWSSPNNVDIDWIQSVASSKIVRPSR